MKRLFGALLLVCCWSRLVGNQHARNPCCCVWGNSLAVLHIGRFDRVSQRFHPQKTVAILPSYPWIGLGISTWLLGNEACRRARPPHVLILTIHPAKNAGMLETLWACGHHHGISWDTWDFHCFAGFLPTVGCGLSRFFFSRAPKSGPVWRVFEANLEPVRWKQFFHNWKASFQRREPNEGCWQISLRSFWYFFWRVCNFQWVKIDFSPKNQQNRRSWCVSRIRMFIHSSIYCRCFCHDANKLEWCGEGAQETRHEEEGGSQASIAEPGQRWWNHNLSRRRWWRETRKTRGVVGGQSKNTTVLKNTFDTWHNDDSFW